MRTAVVVLGFSSWRSGRPHPVQRWRVRVAAGAVRAHGADTVVVSGGAVRNRIIEAETMALLAAALLPDTGIVLERQARSTWENVANSRTLVADFDRVVLASDRMHARRAARYWAVQFPEDADKLAIADDGHWYRHLWVRLPTVPYETVRLLRERLRSR